jgi:hypothetical protein
MSTHKRFRWEKNDIIWLDGQMFEDTAPRTLYVRRDLINVEQFVNWAKEQGFGSVLHDLHCTILFSKNPVDWIKMGDLSYAAPNALGVVDENFTVPPGGPRQVERLGTAVVLHFACSAFCYRHEDMVRRGATHDFPYYQPHVSITYQPPPDLVIENIVPYRGPLVFGPEIFEEIKAFDPTVRKDQPTAERNIDPYAMTF